jgi:hypothetical protein
MGILYTAYIKSVSMAIEEGIQKQLFVANVTAGNWHKKTRARIYNKNKNKKEKKKKRDSVWVK